MTEIHIETLQLTKSYGGPTAIRQLDLKVHKGQILALVGPSGSGKTTLLRLIAGLEAPDSGQIILDNQVVSEPNGVVPPEYRRVGMVFQNHALFPHLTVQENIAFGLHGLAPASRQARITAMLQLVGLDKNRNRYPHELSGGEQQRVALVRALGPEPLLLLLDEPFSSLDVGRREKMRREVHRVLRALRTTAIFVTHDQEEALFMGDRLGILRDGCLEQLGSPEEIFHAPATRFVAEFMGQTDFLVGEITPEGIQTEIGLVRQPLDLRPGTRVELALRPDDVDFSLNGCQEARIVGRHFKGTYQLYRLQLASGQFLHSTQPHTLSLQPGTPVTVELNPGHDLSCFYQGQAV